MTFWPYIQITWNVHGTIKKAMMAKLFNVVTVEELEQIVVDGAWRLGYEGLKDRQLEAIVSFL